MKVFSIIALVFCCFFFFTASGSAADIADVDCPCGCGMKAINCLCGAAMQALNDAGFSADDIKKYLDSQSGNTG